VSKKTSLSDLAQAVLRQVEQSDLEKTAAAVYTEKKTMNSNEAKLLIKMASDVRALASNDRITYADLEKYRKTHAR
jgi:hypothetical protein